MKQNRADGLRRGAMYDAFQPAPIDFLASRPGTFTLEPRLFRLAYLLQYYKPAAMSSGRQRLR